MKPCCTQERNRAWNAKHTKFHCTYCDSYHDAAPSYEDLVEAIKRKDELIAELVTVIKGECVEKIDVDDNTSCNSDPDRQNCEGHVARVTEQLLKKAQEEINTK